MTTRHVYPCELCRSSSLCRRLLYYCTYYSGATRKETYEVGMYVYLPRYGSLLPIEQRQPEAYCMNEFHHSGQNSLLFSSFSSFPFFLPPLFPSAHPPRYLVLSSPLISPHLTFKPPTLNLQPSSLPSSNPLIRPYCLHTNPQATLKNDLSSLKLPSPTDLPDTYLMSHPQEVG